MRVKTSKTLQSSYFAAVLLLVFSSSLTNASESISQTRNHDTDTLIDLSIEELMSVEVTTASRRSQKISNVASAIFVITQDDIRRSGVTNIPDALRMAPGVQVGRIGTDKWAVSIRGFNGRFANKLQVLMDGRSIYNPLFSGVQWEQQGTLLEDIERIEVIRGPNASIWGANAVNGVINIITKKSTDTQGLFLTAGGGSFEHGFLGARYGGNINPDTSYRIYAKGFTRDSMKSVSRESANDEWHNARGGFRLDYDRGADQVTLQGDFFYSAQGDNLDNSLLYAPIIQMDKVRGSTKGGNARFRWDRKLSDDSSIMLQAYYDRVDFNVLSDYRSESFDIDLNHNFHFWDRHDLTWGINYRLYNNKIFDTELLSMSPRQQTNHLISAYISDEISLIPDYLSFIVGTRLDHNDFTGLEIQPNARLIWTPNEKNSIWASVSRAVRTPSRAENDITLKTRILDQIPNSSVVLPFPILTQIAGSSRFNSEKLIAYEIGYRFQPFSYISLDIATFYNDYSQLRDLTAGTLSFQSTLLPHLLLPVGLTNDASADTYGVEISTDWRVNNQWRLRGHYSFLHMKIHSESDFKGFDPTTGSANKVSPQHQASVQSSYDLSEKIQMNLWLRYVSNIDLYKIPDYVTMDAQLILKPKKNVELFLVGQNLFSQKHREFQADFIPSLPVQVPRSIYAGISLYF